MNKFLALSLLPLLHFTACKAKSTFKAAPKSGELAPAEKDQEFEEGEPSEVEPETEGESDETLEIPSEPGVQTKEFDLGTIQPKLDLVWMEDGNLNHITDFGNSLSSNFKKFLESIKGRSDIKVIFLGKNSNTSHAAKQDPNAKDVVIFMDRDVGSSGGLGVLAAGVCPPEQTSVKTDHTWQLREAPIPSGKICGRPLNTELVKKLESGMHLSSTDRVHQANFYNRSDFSNPGFLRNVLRADARMVVVNVAPYNQGLYQYLPQFGKIEEPISPNNFFEVTGLDKDNVTIHNFNKMKTGKYGLCLGLGVNEPATVDRNILPDMTGGKVFDICLPDHTPSFAELTKNVLEVTRSNFKLASSGKVQIVKVMLGAKALSTADYTLKGTTISLKNPTPITAKDKLIVTFKVD